MGASTYEDEAAKDEKSEVAPEAPATVRTGLVKDEVATPEEQQPEGDSNGGK